MKSLIEIKLILHVWWEGQCSHGIRIDGWMNQHKYLFLTPKIPDWNRRLWSSSSSSSHYIHIHTSESSAIVSLKRALSSFQAMSCSGSQWQQARSFWRLCSLHLKWANLIHRPSIWLSFSINLYLFVLRLGSSRLRIRCYTRMFHINLLNIYRLNLFVSV